MPRGKPGTKAPHGALTRYTKHGCRCRLCKDAIRDYGREKHGHRPREVVDAERAAQHGTESKYKHCRCEACRTAATEARRARRRADREAANAYDREYKRRRTKAAA